MDLNHRPPGPEPGALARLRYAPKVLRLTDTVYVGFPQGEQPQASEYAYRTVLRLKPWRLCNPESRCSSSPIVRHRTLNPLVYSDDN